jgi:hypothetical protein
MLPEGICFWCQGNRCHGNWYGNRNGNRENFVYHRLRAVEIYIQVHRLREEIYIQVGEAENNRNPG